MDLAQLRSRRIILTSGILAAFGAGASNLRPHGVAGRSRNSGTGAPLLNSSTVQLAALETEREMLDLLLIIEKTQARRYEAIVTRYDESAFVSAGLPADARRVLESVFEDERTHIATLAGLSGTSRIVPMQFPDSVSLLDLLTEAAEQENFATAAYAGVIPRIEKRKLMATLVGIHSVEARQAAWLAAMLGGDPFPKGIDSALAPNEARQEIDQVIADAQPIATPLATPQGAALPLLAAIAQALGVPTELCGHHVNGAGRLAR